MLLLFSFAIAETHQNCTTATLPGLHREDMRLIPSSIFLALCSPRRSHRRDSRTCGLQRSKVKTGDEVGCDRGRHALSVVLQRVGTTARWETEVPVLSLPLSLLRTVLGPTSFHFHAVRLDSYAQLFSTSHLFIAPPQFALPSPPTSSLNHVLAGRPRFSAHRRFWLPRVYSWTQCTFHPHCRRRQL